MCSEEVKQGKKGVDGVGGQCRGPSSKRAVVYVPVEGHVLAEVCPHGYRADGLHELISRETMAGVAACTKERVGGKGKCSLKGRFGSATVGVTPSKVPKTLVDVGKSIRQIARRRRAAVTGLLYCCKGTDRATVKRLWLREPVGERKAGVGSGKWRS